MTTGQLGTDRATASRSSFAGRWSTLARERSPICLGIAPSTTWLTRWGLPDDADGAGEYCDRVVAASRDLAGVKIQVPFFLRFGEPGVVLLRRCVERWHEHGCAVVLDAKVGDADDTMAAWADFYLGPDSLLAGDAVTANAYMGFGTVDPLLRHAMARACGVLVMVRTSNHAAADVQQAIGSDGRGVAVALADAVTAWNLAQAPQEPVGPAGAVVGARLPESAELVDRLGRSVIEVPGLGRADRDTGEVLAPVRGLLDRTIVTVTTGVLRHGPGVTALRSSLDEWRTAVSG